MSDSPEKIPELQNVSELPYVASLNPEQRQAVVTTEGPVLVLAGAGTGKTRALTARIAYLIHTKKAFPGQILSVTFTNKAAVEMRERVEKLIEEPLPSHTSRTSSGMWLGTFHSLCSRMLRRHAERIGFNQNFIILDDDDQIRLIKQLLSEAGVEPKQNPPRAILAVIQRFKDKGLTPDKASVNASHEDAQPLALYARYQARLKGMNAMDFGDLLLHSLTILQQCPDVLKEFQTRFRYILVDEYQDTNVAQYLWLRLLAMGTHNICCVGDDDQSIYGWRGAEVGNILRFEKDFPEAVTIKLERNYRSTGHILAAASALIDHNDERLGKTLWTDDEEGELVRIKSIWDDGEEARFVGEEVEAGQRDGISLDDMAILVRAGYQTRAFEERFLQLGVPYRVIGGLRFYERLEIRDAVAYLRLINQPNDDLAFERVISTWERSGVGKATLQQLHEHARAQNGSLYSATEALLEAKAIKGKAATSLAAFITQCTGWRTQSDALPLSELAEIMLEEADYIAKWKNSKLPEAPGRLDNLRELFRALEDFPDVSEFLEHVGLVTQATAETGDAMVSLMTLHGAKGLEFHTVFLTGWEEGLFPSQRSMDEKGTAGLEEERRLAYVGITRARRLCTISHAANRRIYNQWQSAIPSRFIEELPEKHIENIDGPLHTQSKSPAPFQRDVDMLIASIQNAASERPDPAKNAGEMKKGARVFHQKFGYGIILKSDGGNLHIAFKHAGTKKVMSDYVEVA